MTLFRPDELAQHAKDIIIQDMTTRYFVKNGLLLNQTTDLQVGMKRYVYTSLTPGGSAAMLAWNAPLSGLAGVKAAIDERFVRVQPIKKTYTVSSDEILQTALVNIDPLKTRATIASQAVLTKIDEIGFSGEADYDILGITNQPAANIVAVQADGTGASTAFSTKTAAQIVRDLNQMIYFTPRATDGTYFTPTILLPTDAYLAAVETLDAANDNESALTIFLKNARQVYPSVTVKMCPFLDTLGLGGQSIAITMNNQQRFIEHVKVPGIRVSKMHETIDGYMGIISAYSGGIALKDTIPFNYTYGV